MLAIRLQRTGRRNQPMYRVVLTDSKNGPKSGAFKEILGSYNPHANEKQLKADRISHWIGLGAQTSGTVHNLLVSEGIVKGDKKNVLPKKTPIVSEKEEEPKEETPDKAPTPEAPATQGESASAETTEEASAEVVEEPAEETEDAPEESAEETPTEKVEETPAPEEETKEEDTPAEEGDTEEDSPASKTS